MGSEYVVERMNHGSASSATLVQPTPVYDAMSSEFIACDQVSEQQSPPSHSQLSWLFSSSHLKRNPSKKIQSRGSEAKDDAFVFRSSFSFC